MWRIDICDILSTHYAKLLASCPTNALPTYAFSSPLALQPHLEQNLLFSLILAPQAGHNINLLRRIRLSRLPRYGAFIRQGFYRTGVYTFPAADALRGIWAGLRVNFYMTGCCAAPAGNTFFLIALHMQDRNFVKQGINRAQRTQ